MSSCRSMVHTNRHKQPWESCCPSCGLLVPQRLQKATSARQCSWLFERVSIADAQAHSWEVLNRDRIESASCPAGGLFLLFAGRPSLQWSATGISPVTGLQFKFKTARLSSTLCQISNGILSKCRPGQRSPGLAWNPRLLSRKRCRPLPPAAQASLGHEGAAA